MNHLFVNVGKSYAAYVETLRAPPSRFDQLIESLAQGQPRKVSLSDSERRGIKLFIGKGRCLLCHHGPDLTDGEFHDVRVKPRAGPVAMVASVATVRMAARRQPRGRRSYRPRLPSCTIESFEQPRAYADLIPIVWLEFAAG